MAACWYGPIAGWVGLAFILFAPVNHQCFGVSAARGSSSGSFCDWSTGLTGSKPLSLSVLVVAISIVLALELLSSDARFLILIGMATTALWVVVLVVLLPNYNVVYWAEVHGLEFYSANLEAETLLMLPSGLLPVIAGIRRLRGQSTEVRAAS
jgi:hypothetical protein